MYASLRSPTVFGVAMINGVVTVHREAVIPLVVRGPTGKEEHIDAVIDTGFNGSLTLPSRILSTLDLPWRRRAKAFLADGSESVFDIFEGYVVWDAMVRRIPVDAAETVPLVGMGLLEGFEFNVQVKPGGPVTIKILA
jgi:clan AA aspartic protease